MRLSVLQYLKRPFGRNVMLSFFGQVTPILAAIVTMPYLVRMLGTDRVGLLSLVLIAVGYFTILDFGLGRAVTKVISEVIERRDNARVASVFWSAARFQVLMGVAGGLVLILLTPLLVTRLLHIPENLQSEATLCMILSALSLPTILFSSSLVGLLQAAQRFDMAVSVQAPTSVANYVLPVAGAVFWPNLPFVVLILVATRFVSTIFLFRFAVRLFPDVRKLHPFHRQEFLALLKFGGWLTVSSIANPILIYLDRFVIGGLEPVSEVAYYSVPADAVGRLLIIPASLVMVLFPMISASGGHSGRLIPRSLLVVLASLGLPIVAIVIFGNDLMRIWMGQEFATHSGLALRVLAVGVLVNGLAFIPATYLQAAGRPDITAKLNFAELPLHVLVAYYGVKTFGILGAAIAWDLRVLIDALLLFFFSHRLSKSTKAFPEVRETAPGAIT
jgi:O-antigen/teichoic acid export membrane protein